MKGRIFILFLLIIFSCDKDKDDATSDLRIYADRFFQEGEIRGRTFDQSNLTLKFVSAEEIAPYAGYGNPNPPTVRIVKTAWEKYTDVQKEILMLHELGHAILVRPHTNELLPSCDYKSMMLDGNQFIVYGDKSPKREYYIDELFDPNTPYPSWGGHIGENKTVFIDNTTTATFKVSGTSANTGDVEEDGTLHIHGGSLNGVGYWQIPISPEDIPNNASIVAKFKIKTSQISGDGVWAVLEADPDQNKYYHTDTYSYHPAIKGSIDYQEFTLIVNCYPGNTDLYLTFVLGALSAGDVWIKDVEVAYHN